MHEMTPCAEKMSDPGSDSPNWRHPADSNPFLESSPPDPTPIQPTEILMISPPNSLDDSVDDNLVFLTPPEHQRRMSSSSDDDPLLGFRKSRVSEEEPAMKKIKVSGPPLLGGETEEDVAVDDSGIEMCVVTLADDSPAKVNVDCLQKSASIYEVVEAETSIEKSIAENCDESSFICGSPDIDHKIEDANIELGCVISDSGINESGHGRCVGVGEVEIVAEVGVDDGKIVSSVGKRSQDIDELMVARKKLIGGTSNVAESASELVNKENSRGVSGVGAVGRATGLREFLNALKVIVRSLNNTSGDDEVDVFETARKRGMAFPRPRFWPLVDDES